MLRNLDLTNYVEWGLYDGAEFTPIGEILPGEFYVLRLSRFLGSDISTGSGTATTGSGNQLMIKAVTAPCNVVVEAFEV